MPEFPVFLSENDVVTIEEVLGFIVEKSNREGYKGKRYRDLQKKIKNQTGIDIDK